MRLPSVHPTPDASWVAATISHVDVIQQEDRAHTHTPHAHTHCTRLYYHGKTPRPKTLMSVRRTQVRNHLENRDVEGSMERTEKMGIGC